jgi:hypothetical protein
VSEENKAFSQRFVEEALNKGNLDVVDEVYASTFVSHDPPLPKDREAPKQSSSSSTRTSVRFLTGTPPSRTRSPKGTR